MVVRKQVEQVRPPVLLMPWRDLLKIAIAGAVIGIVTIALYVLLDKYVFTPTLCSDLNADTGRCENKLYFASGLAMVLGGIAALFYTVQQRVYRPLLVVLLVTVGLWNSLLLIAQLPMLLAACVAAALFALAYAVFSWLVQLRNFVAALAVSTIIVVILRIILA